MFSDLVLIHRPTERAGAKRGRTLSEDVAAANVSAKFLWQTCLRQIAITDEGGLEELRPALTRGDEIYHGDAAFRFVLQVICGLRSPLIGETEVNGQFKNAVAAYEFQPSPWDSQLRRFFKALFEDAKRIRQAHLVDLGSQSYGSVLRRDLKGLKRIYIIGAGQLVQEILPWIAKDGNDIHVYARDPEKARASLNAARNVVVHSLLDRDSLTNAEALIVAAPIAASAISNWLPKETKLKIIADLRADSASDRLACAEQVIDLGQVFARISTNQALIEERKNAALSAVEAAVRSRGEHVEYRPFGWEDVCA